MLERWNMFDSAKMTELGRVLWTMMSHINLSFLQTYERWGDLKSPQIWAMRFEDGHWIIHLPLGGVAILQWWHCEDVSTFVAALMELKGRKILVLMGMACAPDDSFPHNLMGWTKTSMISSEVKYPNLFFSEKSSRFFVKNMNFTESCVKKLLWSQSLLCGVLWSGHGEMVQSGGLVDLPWRRWKRTTWNKHPFWTGVMKLLVLEGSNTTNVW